MPGRHPCPSALSSPVPDTVHTGPARAHTDRNLLDLIELLCRVGLDTRLRLLPKTDLQQLLLQLLENIRDWPGKVLRTPGDKAQAPSVRPPRACSLSPGGAHAAPVVLPSALWPSRFEAGGRRSGRRRPASGSPAGCPVPPQPAAVLRPESSV